MSSWHNFLQTEGAQFDGVRVTDFSDAAGERAAATGDVLCDLGHLGLIRVGGTDAQTFLQGQFSNDVRKVDGEHSQLSAYCSPKGRILATLRVAQRDGDYLLLLPTELREEVQTRLQKYVLMSKVTLTDADGELARIGLSGPGAEQAIGALGLSLPAELHAAATANGITALRIAGSEPRFILFAAAEAMPAIWQQLKATARPVGAAAWEWLDITAGVPIVVRETVEAFVPQMVNLQLIDGVSFKKGCYPGQEVVARMQYLGKLKRRMYLAHLDNDDCPSAGSDLFSPASASGQGAGKVVNAQSAPNGGCDLLVVAEIASAEGDALHLGDANGPLLKLAELPYPFDDAAKEAAS